MIFKDFWDIVDFSPLNMVRFAVVQESSLIQRE